ncbi:tRNA 2-thiolation protein NcsA [Halodesulfurarchaeum formicicum]|uniref:Arginosuccinate synthase n=1 Tax=Halodesulfurarchaeum formicicum TaxID=1873524 RepID=A0A1J1ACZ2_9EURY|nr:TIGR00269 family protein [Halodesulfurarchaeum formicicum]APE96020.1 arginosuccinate synthase [Halodesulfurarchaeum formicicum]
MECDRCGREAVIHVAYSGAHLCGTHLRQSVDRRVRRRIRSDGLLPDTATPEDPVTWLIGLSGGKDSAVLTHILADTFGDDPRVELIALSIHEGIAGYRDESLSAAESLVEDRPVEYVSTSYEREFDLRMDEVAEADPWDMAPCAYCGVFRRDILSAVATEYDADLLLTGHNLDDEAETALMNIFEGDVAQMAQHYDASLAPLEAREADSPFVPRAKPLRDVPESEIALYARLSDIPAHIAECPHSSESFRGTVQELLLELEADHPGTRHSIMSGYEELAKLAATQKRRGEHGPAGVCEECGAPTDGDRCRACELQAALE